MFLTYSYLIGQEISSPVEKWTRTFDTTYYQSLTRADSIIDLAIKYAKETKKPIDLGHAFYRKGIVYDIKGISDSAIYFLLNGVDNLKKTDDWVGLTSAYNNLSIYYYNIRDYEKAVEISLKEIEVYDKENEHLDKAYTLNNMSLALNYLDRTEEALEAQFEALRLFQEKNDTIGMQSALANIGQSYYRRKELNNALKYYREAEKLIPHINNKSSQITFYNSMATVYLQKKSYNKSLDYLQKALAIAETYESVERKQYLYETLSEVAEAKGDYKQALEYHKEFKRLRDEFYKEERNNAMAEYERKFELFELREEKEASLLKIEKQERLILLSLAGIAVLIIIVFLIFYAYNLKKKASLQSQKRLEEKSLMAKEMHHRVKNNLQLVGSMINIQSREMPKESQEKLEKITSSIQSMAAIHEGLYQSKDWEWVDVTMFFSNLRSQMERSTSFNIAVDIEADNLSLDLDTTISLGIVINELFINSIKHAFDTKGKVQISLKKEKDNLILIYQDNGKGLPEGYSFEKGNFGTKMIRAIIKKLKATVNISSTANGAFFEFIISRFNTK